MAVRSAYLACCQTCGRITDGYRHPTGAAPTYCRATPSCAPPTCTAASAAGPDLDNQILINRKLILISRKKVNETFWKN